MMPEWATVENGAAVVIALQWWRMGVLERRVAALTAAVARLTTALVRHTTVQLSDVNIGEGAGV